jgi:hypothetical protein
MVDLVKDLVNLEPKLKQLEINTFGTKLMDFDDPRVVKEYYRDTYYDAIQTQTPTPSKAINFNNTM